MGYLSTIFREARKDLGYSQVQLAGFSGVSLPTIQNIEANKGNPSFEVIQKLSESLGLSLELKPAAANWDLLSAHGVPLLSKAPKIVSPSGGVLVKQIQFACRELTQEDLTSNSDAFRKKQALKAALWALETHFPTFFKKNLSHSPVIQRLLSEKKTGELIKLRRIAIESLSRYL